MVKTGNECLFGNYMSTQGRLCYESPVAPERGSRPSFSFRLVLNTLLGESETHNALVVMVCSWRTKHAEHTAYHGT